MRERSPGPFHDLWVDRKSRPVFRGRAKESPVFSNLDVSEFLKCCNTIQDAITFDQRQVGSEDPLRA